MPSTLIIHYANAQYRYYSGFWNNSGIILLFILLNKLPILAQNSKNVNNKKIQIG
jgi:hypothetical protein